MWTAFLLSAAAGAATILGGVLVVSRRQFSPRMLSWSLSFAAGVMLFVSFYQLLPMSSQLLNAQTPHGQWWAMTAFILGGIGFMALEHIIPETKPGIQGEVSRLSWYTLIAITAHNFPEGMLTFSAASQPDLSKALPALIAIGIHNLPEGLVVAAPIFYATRSRGQALLAATVAAIAEPIGGLLGMIILGQVFKDWTAGLAFGFIAGVMVMLSVEQLIPEAKKINSSEDIPWAILLGMAVMAFSLLLVNVWL